MFFKRTDHLTTNLTSYDFVKCVTLIFMLIDHTGAFFIPDDPWWRVFGRLGFPAWFFLAGFSDSRSVSKELWIGAAILIAVTMILGMNIFALNALVSYICIRIFMTPHYQRYFSSWELLLYVTFAMTLLAYPTNHIFEYGTLAFMVAMMGYATRHKDDISIGKSGRIVFFSAVIIATSIIEINLFNFDMEQGLTCVALLSVAAVILFHFKRAEYPQLTQQFPKPLTSLIQFCGRYTLEIYVIHLVLVRTYVFFFMNDGRFEFMEPRIGF